MIDETLTWDDQITLITKKVNKGLNVMRRLRDFFDMKILTNIYQTLVQHTLIFVPRFGKVSVPHSVINFSDYKIELLYHQKEWIRSSICKPTKPTWFA